MHLLPHDTAYLGMSADQLCRYQGCRILHFMIHDRISCLRYGRPSRALWQALAIAGSAGFTTALGIHPVIGYLSLTHLAPAVLGMLVFACGLVLAISGTLFARP
jgi:hypothetical protein